MNEIRRENSLAYRVADALSYVLHPGVLALLTVAVFSSHFRNALGVLGDLAIIIAGLLPGSIYIVYKTRRGDFGHYHMTLKEERRVAFPLLFLGLCASFAVYAWIGAPALMLREMLVALVAGGGMLAITRVWKISAHSSIAMICAAVLLTISVPFALLVAALGVAVGVSRLVVKHHRPAEVLAGWAYGFGATALLNLLLSIYA